MTRGPRHRPARVLATAALFSLLSATTAAQADPMRPLGAVARPVPAPPPATPGAGGSARFAPSPALPAALPAARGDGGPVPGLPGTPSAAPAPPRLVALRQDSEGRWHALFDERWLTLGSRLGGETVTAIDGRSVHLSQGRERRVVHLLPPLEPATRAASPALTTARPTGNPRP
jgi:hypothetical protein